MIAFPPFRWQGIVDFLVLAGAIYGVLRWSQQARALRIALGIAGLHACALAARYLDLIITSWILESTAIVAVVLLVVVFQPELRHALMRLDSMLRNWSQSVEDLRPRARAISDAAFELTRQRLGALIVITRQDSIGELMEGGLGLDAQITSELLISTFQKPSPLHDGAVVITGNRISRAGVVLPLTERMDVPPQYGTRHRAALGLAERSDALVVVVSEERAEVTLVDGRLARVIGTDAELAGVLRRTQYRVPLSLRGRLRRLFTQNLAFKFAALGFAALFWSLSFVPTAATVRLVSVPVEFSSVPSGMQIAQQSADRIEVQLRGSGWIMDSVNVGKLVARFDLSKAKEGWQTLEITTQAFNLPPGITIDQITPRTVSLRIARRR